MFRATILAVNLKLKKTGKPTTIFQLIIVRKFIDVVRNTSWEVGLLLFPYSMAVPDHIFKCVQLTLHYWDEEKCKQ